MAKHRVWEDVLTCDATDEEGHTEDVESVEVTFADTGKVLVADVCGKHRSTVTLADMVTIGHPARQRKPAGRPQGAAGMADMFRPQ